MSCITSLVSLLHFENVTAIPSMGVALVTMHVMKGTNETSNTVLDVVSRAILVVVYNNISNRMEHLSNKGG